MEHTVVLIDFAYTENTQIQFTEMLQQLIRNITLRDYSPLALIDIMSANTGKLLCSNYTLSPLSKRPMNVLSAIQQELKVTLQPDAGSVLSRALCYLAKTDGKKRIVALWQSPATMTDLLLAVASYCKKSGIELNIVGTFSDGVQCEALGDACDLTGGQFTCVLQRNAGQLFSNAMEFNQFKKRVDKSVTRDKTRFITCACGSNCKIGFNICCYCFAVSCSGFCNKCKCGPLEQ